MPRTGQHEHSTPIYPTSGFIFDSAEDAQRIFADEQAGNIYTRFNNPSVDEFVEKICLLEGADEGIATASGMAAVFLSFISFLRSGDHVLASRSLFGSTHAILTSILPRWGISHTYVDAAASPGEWEENIMPNTRLIYLETPSNPGLDVIDISMLSALAEENNCLLVVDNCFATPYLQRPIELGADIVCHSATKFIDGQGRTLGGAIVGSSDLMEEVKMMSRNTGPSMSPFNAWILSKSLETLGVRMEQHCKSALEIAIRMQKTAGIASVRYPFLDSHPQAALAKAQMLHGGAVVTFEVEGGKTRCFKFINALRMLSVSSNLGDTRTIVTHPATTTHSKLADEDRALMGISDSMIRLSVGLEDLEDIYSDILQALEASK